jgi:hypothetical protein
VSPDLAMDKDKSKDQLTTRAVESVRPANGHNSCQTLPRLNVLLDHLPFATADKNNLLMDTHVLHAQPVWSKAWLTKNNVLDQTVEDNMKSNLELIPTTVEDVRPANGHNSLQMLQELNVLLDH